MKIHLAICPLGVFACDEGGKIIDRQLFEKNPKSAAAKLLQLREGKLAPELKTVYDRVRKKSAEVFLEGDRNFGLEVITEFPNPCGIFLRRNLERLARETGFPQFDQFTHNLSLDVADARLSADLKKPDKLVIQLVNSLDEVNENVNVLGARLDEISLLKIDQKNSSIPQHFGLAVSSLRKTQKSLEDDLSRLMKEHFPNIATVAGPTIGARLISIAGDVGRLSKMASSKIQVLGAEKALFRHLTTGAKPPKYGVILSHPALANAPYHIHGRIARALAAKISIAVKADVYSKKFIGEQLKKGLEDEIKKIKRMKQ